MEIFQGYDQHNISNYLYLNVSNLADDSGVSEQNNNSQLAGLNTLANMDSDIYSVDTNSTALIVNSTINETIQKTISTTMPEGYEKLSSIIMVPPEGHHKLNMTSADITTMTYGTTTHLFGNYINSTNFTLSNSHYQRSVLLMILISFIVIAVLCNLFACLVVKLDQSLHHMTYYFYSSLAILHIVVASTVMPTSLVVFISDKFTSSDVYCKLWVTLDLFYCNNTCLHLAFTNMDTYLRLKDPLRHGRIITWCSFIMWTGASWVISFVQGIAQFMLSQADSKMIPQGVCFIGDKNFLILGTLFSFIIPNIISLGFYGLCYKEIRAIKLGRYFDENGSLHQQYQYGSENSVTDEEECSDGSQDSGKCESKPAEVFPLSAVMNRNHSLDNNRRDHVDTQETMTSFNQESELDDINNLESIQGHLNVAFADEHNTSDSCTLMLRTTQPNGLDNSNHIERTESTQQCPDECMRHEIVLNKLMFGLLLFTITLWAPLSFGNFVLGLCSFCQMHLTTQTLCILKWIAYSTTWIAPMLYIRFSSYVRSAGYKLLTCHYCQ